MRVRFAPSPTGFLHIGNARTAICNHLIAKKHGAAMVLRIEDTDMERSSRESEESILADLKWLGVDWAEGPDLGGPYGPYRQSERFDIYREYSEKLLRQGSAYHCYCSQEELEAERAASEAEKGFYVYSGRCRDLSPQRRAELEREGRKPTIRFRVPEGETVVINDLIKGRVSFDSENIGGDFIIVRSDGTPVYNYIVIIDDELMKVTHVIRGEDHLSNTPKQVLIAKALGLPVPEYAHLALVMGDDRKKLSKRHGITSVDLYRREGYLPEALFNYLAMLGWATESGEEILGAEEISRQIEIGSLAKSAAVFDFQKLRWMNGMYIRSYPLERIVGLATPFLEQAGFDAGARDPGWVSGVIDVLRGYCEVLSDISRGADLFFSDIIEPDEETDQLLREPDSRTVIEASMKIAGGDISGQAFVEGYVAKVKEMTSLKGKKLFHPIRGIITGRLSGPELDRALPLIGLDKCRKRIQYMHGRYCS